MRTGGPGRYAVLVVDSAEGPGISVDVVESILRSRVDDTARVVSVRRIRPWTVARCEVITAGGTRTVMVKWLRSNPDGFRVDRRQIATEAAGLRLVEAHATGVAPRLLAHDPEADVLVIGDLAPRRTLHSLLSSGLAAAGDAGATGLRTFAATLGRLHAATASLDVDGPWDDAARSPLEQGDVDRVLDRLGELVPVTASVDRDVRAVRNEIGSPGSFAAFSNGDSGANNCLVRPDGSDGRLIDFEHACRRHALLDVAALYVPGSMWLSVADPVPLGVEAAYRDVAGAVLPGVADDERFAHGLAAACAVVPLERLRRFDKLDAREPGHHSRAQLIIVIDRTVATMARTDRYGALAEWLSLVASTLRRRWPDADREAPFDYALREPFDADP